MNLAAYEGIWLRNILCEFRAAITGEDVEKLYDQHDDVNSTGDQKSVLETIKSYEADILEQEQDITEIGKAYEELMTWSGTFGPQFRGAVSPGFKSMFPYLRSDPPPDEEDPDSAEQELKPATEVRGILKDALESIKQEDEEKGGKTSYILKQF